MSTLRIGAVIAMGLAIWPEVGRYVAERELHEARSAVLVGGSDARLEWGRAKAMDAAARIPEDSRGLLIAGGALLLARRPADGFELYRRAFLLGERAEIDLNLGRAYAMLDRRKEAFAAFVRTIWVNPLLIDDLPRAAQPLVVAEVARLEALLRSGGLKQAPAIQLP